MIHIDLAELPDLVRLGFLRERGMGFATFLRRDHVGDPARPLAEAVSDLVQERTGLRPAGPIRLTTQLRTLGYYFSPINLFHCYSLDGESVEFIVAEVTNTPWLQRHCYVLWSGNRTSDEGSRVAHFEDPKRFHVSPFMDMNQLYRWRVAAPAERLSVRIENVRDGQTIFDATLALERKPLERSTLRNMFVRYPMLPLRTTAAIYLEAFKLWIKGCPYHSHPNDKAA